MDIRLIKPYEKNAKKHPKKQIEQVAASIKEFGFNQPIVVDKNNVIIVGHGRFEAAKLLGLTDVPAIAVDLNEEKANAYRLTDNKLNESEWDMELVVEELKGLSEEMLNLTGFDKDLIIEPDVKDNEVPEIPKVAISKIGDIYELGGHRILCGDSTKLDDIEKLMNGRKADAVVTDPPYNVDYEGGTKDALKIENDKKSDGDFKQFLIDAFSGMVAYLKPGGVFYIWHADLEGYNFRAACHECGMKVRQCLIWNKNAAVMGRQDYHWKHEPCLYGWKDGASHLWNSDRKQNTILNFDRPQRNSEHPTMKPVDLLVYLITNNTKGEDIILDTFIGSGSTMIAAEKSGRVCYGIELDPKYVDVCVERYCDYTGNNKVILNGKKYIWQKKEDQVK